MALEIRSIPVSKINPAEYNPRVDLQPGDDDYEKLKRSLDEFGCVEPLVWNHRTGNLVGGHQRLKVLIANGASEVDVGVVDLPLEKEKALNVALNKIQGDWDKPKLAALIEGLSALPDFDVSLTGFDTVEVGQLLDRFGSLSSGGEDGFDLADTLDAAADLPPVTQKGELLELGPHRLLCGDSAKSENIQRLLASLCIHEVDLVFTDPPITWLTMAAAEVDVSVVDLPLEKEKALNIALNKIHGDYVASSNRQLACTVICKGLLENRYQNSKTLTCQYCQLVSTRGKL